MDNNCDKKPMDDAGKKKFRRARKVDTNWSSEMCFNLINMVKSKPNLWIITHSDYKNRNSREIAWEEISKEMNLAKDEVSNKWNLLRQQFRNAYNKVKETKSGQAAVAQKPPNQFYNALLFLQPILSADSDHRTSNYIMSTESEASTTSFDTTPQVVDLDHAHSDYDLVPISSSLPSKPASSNSSSVKPTPRRRKFYETDFDRYALLKNASDFLANTREEDEFEIWGKSIAVTLRNYPDGRAVRIAKSKINQVMASLEAGELDRTTISSPRYNVIATSDSKYTLVNVENIKSDPEFNLVDSENPNTEFNAVNVGDSKSQQ